MTVRMPARKASQVRLAPQRKRDCVEDGGNTEMEVAVGQRERCFGGLALVHRGDKRRARVPERLGKLLPNASAFLRCTEQQVRPGASRPRRLSASEADYALYAVGITPTRAAVP